jgi:hypothetical protein
MKGILRSALFFCMAWRLQRLFLGGSLLLAVILRLIVALVQPCRAVTTASMLSGLFSVLCVYGVLSIGTVTFRAASAPRTLRLMPYARLQLVLGILLAEVLLTLFVTVNIGFMQGVNPGGTFVRVFTMMSLSVFWLFLVFSNSPWQRWVATLVLCIAMAVLIWRLQTGIVLVRLDSAQFVLVTLAAWPLFAAWYLRAKRIAPPPQLIDNWGSGRTPCTKDIETRDAALNIYLLGQASVARACWPDVVLTLALSVTFIVISALPRLDLSPVLILTFLIAGGMCFQRVRPIAQRARALWIRSGCSRWELFKTAERLSLQCMAWVGLAALVVSVVDWMILPHPSANWRYLFTVGLTTLLCDVYFGLVGVSRPSLSPFVVIASSALNILILLPDSLWLSWGVSWSHALILTTEIVLAPALRYIAQWRWQRIDWLICKPALLSSQAMRPAT